ncbi:hypothetical protein BJX70DRAFT_396885 [Aspergillus crustosus]
MDMDTEPDTPMKPLPRIQEFTPLNSPEEVEEEQALISSTNGDDMNEKENNETPTKAPKSTPTKAKGKGKGKASAAQDTPTKTPITGKRGRKPGNAGPATPSKKAKKDIKTEADGNGDEDAETPTAAKAGEAGPTSSAAGTPTRATLPPIPTSLAKAGAEDRLILRLRDEEKHPWPTINKLFVATTGIKVGSSTLRMRHGTMKANFAGITEEDESRLLRLKKEIEYKFETEKWHRIVEAIAQDGGNKYPPAALQKKFRELSRKSESASLSNSTPASSSPGSASSSGTGAAAGSSSAAVKEEMEE